MKMPGMDIWNFIPKKIKYKKHTIQTYSFGSGKKKIIALPAFPHSGLIYANLYKYHGDKDFEIVTFDLPGWVGNSENIFTETQFSFEECVNVCRAVIHHYGFDKVSIIGFSFGTAVETLLAYKIRDKVEKLVFVSPFVDYYLGGDDFNLPLIQRVYKLKLAKALKYYVRSRFDHIYSKQLAETGMSPDLLLEYRKMILNSDANTLLESIHQLFTVDLRTYIHGLDSIPVMVVNSRDENKMFRRNAELIRRMTKKDQSLFVHGRHEDFLLKPHEHACVKVIDFLVG